MGPIDNKSVLVQVMAWRRTGDKPLPEPMLDEFTDAYMRHSITERPQITEKYFLFIDNGNPFQDEH